MAGNHNPDDEHKSPQSRALLLTSKAFSTINKHLLRATLMLKYTQKITGKYNLRLPGTVRHNQNKCRIYDWRKKNYLNFCKNARYNLTRSLAKIVKTFTKFSRKWNFSRKYLDPVFRIVTFWDESGSWIRILDYGSGSCSFRQWLSRCQLK